MSHKTLCGAVQSKFWGQTQCIFVSETTEVHHLKIKKGGYCSKHRHNYKWNRFFVISGSLDITIFKEKGEDITSLTDGMFTDIPPGVYHRFNANSDTECDEIYWIDVLDIHDIERQDTGGLNE